MKVSTGLTMHDVVKITRKSWKVRGRICPDHDVVQLIIQQDDGREIEICCFCKVGTVLNK